MRKSKREAATRKRIIRAAAAEFRRSGIVGTGLTDLMAAAGLTHGGFYKHFESKNQLVAEACADAVGSVIERVKATASTESLTEGLETAVASYLSPRHRDDPSDGCPLAALGSEIARCDAETRGAATEGFLKLVEVVAGKLAGTSPDVARRRTLVTVSTMIGALTMSRIVTDPELSAEILHEAAMSLTRRFLLQ